MTLTDANTQATLRYTLNGTDPTTSDPVITSGSALTIGNYTVKVKAYKDGCDASDVRMATYAAEGQLTNAAVAAGDWHSLALDVDGLVWAWGSNGDGRLGDGSTTQRTTPVRVAGITGVTAIAAGSAHSLALRVDRTVWAWGSNANGQLGADPATTPRSFLPIEVAGISDAISIAGGGNHSVAAKSDGSVWAWGSNSNGQLGDETTTQHSAPAQARDLSGAYLSAVVAVAAGQTHSLALKNDGTVWAWGANGGGQLGDGTTTQQLTAVQVRDVSGGYLSDVVAVAAGQSHSLAVRSDGTAWAWGANDKGQLGDGTTTPRPTAVQVRDETGAYLTQVVAVASRKNHSYALKSDGTIWACGYNGSGQLGDGSTTQRTQAVRVGTLSDMTALAAGDSHGLAVAADRSVWSWGGNSYGQLGDGTTSQRVSPVKAGEEGFNWKAGTPLFSPLPGGYQASQNVVITSVTPGASIYYTTDGTTPSSSSYPYVGPVAIMQTTRLQAIAVKAGMAESNVADGLYVLTVPRPTFSVSGAGVIFYAPFSVRADCALADATIRFTTDGSDPATSTNTIPAGGTVIVDHTLTLKAIAVHEGWTNGSIAQASYTLQVATPSFSPGGGAYTAVQEVTVATTSPDATIHFTLNGAEPTESDPVIVSGATVTVAGSLTLRAKAWRLGWSASGTAVASYAMTLEPPSVPSFSPPPGRYASAQDVTLTSATQGVTIRYTLDGGDPGHFSPVYTAPIHVSATTTIKARAFAHDHASSEVVTATYDLDADGVPATPTVLPPGGTFAAGLEVSVACATPDAVIHYTIDGRDPTEANPTIVSGGILRIVQSTRVKLKAFGTGPASGTQSAVRTADYLITGAIAAGDSHVLLLRDDGSVWAWGANGSGQLGNGETSSFVAAPAPVQLTTDTSLTNVVAVAADANHSLALKRDGTVWAWGDDSAGQLGNCTTTSQSRPAQVRLDSSCGSTPVYLTDVVAIAAGGDHSLAVKRDRTVWAWGRNWEGRLGDGTLSDRKSAVLVRQRAGGPALGGVTAVAAGGNFSLALKTDGAESGDIWAFGDNGKGRLGDGTTTSRSAPVQVLQDALGVAAGDSSSYAIAADRTLWAWGYNHSGKLGDGTWTDRLRPVKTEAQDFNQVTSASGDHWYLASAIADGRVWMWGSGDFGSLGDGAVHDRSYPGVVPGLSGIIDLAQGTYFAVALSSDGSLWGWGDNRSGQLGLDPGTVADSYAPIRLTPETIDGTRPWSPGDLDRDTMPDVDELQHGCDPMLADTNGDGLLDGVAVAAGVSCSSPDVDGDGVTNAVEIAGGTDPFRSDSDEDGGPDGEDCFPLDPTRSACSAPIPGDTTPPDITLTEPTSAELVSSTTSP